MSDPSISVIMPVYNAELFVKETIDSVLNQTFSDFELLIIDDKGQDRSMEIIRSIKDPRIKIFENDINRGIAFSSNVGLKNANGKYIAIMDDDDIAMPERFRTEFNFLEANPGIDVVAGASVTIDETGKIITYQAETICNPKRLKAEFLFQDRIYNSTAMFRRDFVKKHNIWFKDGFLGMQDFKFWSECAAYGTIANIAEVFMHWRKHDSNVTLRSKQLYRKERAAKFAEILKDSLKMQGFVLSDAEADKFCKVFREYHTEPVPFEDLMDVLNILKKIMRQAEKRGDNNLEELTYACKRNWSRQMEFCDRWL